ncbi:hypothetical protein Ciccas_006214 [Cichlidogyrus casuarinus]|uniref:Uncharacterized protein n=1 Tax=Cichlidogyrus casuarinus TaxID=1844966 RepID=A0ABD2Q6G0_9PLAT
MKCTLIDRPLPRGGGVRGKLLGNVEVCGDVLYSRSTSVIASLIITFFCGLLNRENSMLRIFLL